MRKRLLGTIAAVAAGAGAAWGQAPTGAAPPPPAPIGVVGSLPGGGIPEPMPPIHAPGGMIDPGAVFPGGPMPGGPMGGPGMGGMPGYPPGTHGQDAWQKPFTMAEGGYNSRLAPRWWVNTEYLLWFAQSQPTIFPFVTTSAPIAGGVIGNTSTQILHASSDLGYNTVSGFRVTGGWFRDDNRRHGWYASGFATEQKANIFTAASDLTGQPLLARPFINAGSGLQSVLTVSFPTFVSGGVEVYTSTKTWGAEIGPIVNVYRSCPEDEGCLWNIDLLGAFRFLQVDEVLRMSSASNVIPGNTLPFDGKLYGAPAQISVVDNFDTVNQFYGGQVGFNSEMRYCRTVLSLGAKIAFGVMHERLEINGTSTLVSGPFPNSTRSVVRSGLFANSTNNGRFNDDEFAVIPEITAGLGYTWRSWLTTHIGYNFMFVSRVVRPGNVYNPAVDPAVIPTSPSFGLGGGVPVANPFMTKSEFWLQGVNFGFTVRY